MSGKNKIPVHSMDDWFSGIYIKSFTDENRVTLAYEISEPHRHDFYYCVLLDQGCMDIRVDVDRVSLIGPTLFLSYPGQVHQIVQAQMKRGWFIAFDPSRLDAQLLNILDQCLSETIVLHLSEIQCAEFYLSIQQLFSLYTETTTLYQQEIIHSLVTALIYRVASIYLSVERLVLADHSSRSVGIAKEFKQLLRRNYKALKKPSDFAGLMNISVSHLNDTVRAVTGRSVTASIQEELMREAKRLLCHSGLSLKEIADDLGYEDVGYFSRLFRKVVGMSANHYRMDHIA